MNGLRAGLEEMAEHTPVYGDLDRAIRQVERRRRRDSWLALSAAAAALALVLGTVAAIRDPGRAPQPAGPPSGVENSLPVLSALDDGTVTPGRYRYVVRPTCDPDMGCPPGEHPAIPDIAITVPAGWHAKNEFHLLEPDAVGTRGPKGAGLVLGWTTYWARVFSQPCRPWNLPAPDVEVGPTVDDLVDTLVAHPRLDVSEPTRLTLGGHPARFLTLTGPSDISGCVEWRPWEPSPYLQGAGNRWDLWFVDVDGVRVVIMAGYYPRTPERLTTEMRAMVDSIEFMPSSTER